MLGVIKELWLLGHRSTGAAFVAIYQHQVSMANYSLQIFIDASKQLT